MKAVIRSIDIVLSAIPVDSTDPILCQARNTLVEARKELDRPSVARVKSQLDIADEALRKICHTSPLVDSGLSFREWAKGTARDALERIHNPDSDSVMLENSMLMAITENERDAARAELAASRDILTLIVADYDHPWPNEDAATTEHRINVWGRISAVMKGQPPVDNAFVAEGCDQFPSEDKQHATTYRSY